MQFLCGNTDLSTKPKLKAICKAGRGIVIDTGTVNAGKEQLFFSITFRNDGIRMVGAMLFNMIDRCQRLNSPAPWPWHRLPASGCALPGESVHQSTHVLASGHPSLHERSDRTA